MSRIQTIPVTLLDGTETEGGWVDLFTIGTPVFYRGERTERDQAFAQRIVENARWWREEYGKEPVMLRQHEREGIQYGRWADVRIHDGKVQGLAGFLSDVALDLYRNGQLSEWSPGFGDVINPHTGDELKDFMVEGSFVDRGHQWDIRPPSLTNPTTVLESIDEIYTFEEIDMDTNTQNPSDAVTLDTVAANLTELSSTVQKLVQWHEDQAPPADPDGEGDSVETQLRAEIAKLRDEVDELRKTNTMQALAADGIDGALAEGLAMLKATNPQRFDAAVADARKRFTQPTPRTQSPIGGLATPATTSDADPQKIVALAAEEGIEPGEGKIMGWVMTHHPDAVDAVATHLNL